MTKKSVICCAGVIAMAIVVIGMLMSIGACANDERNRQIGVSTAAGNSSENHSSDRFCDSQSAFADEGHAAAEDCHNNIKRSEQTCSSGLNAAELDIPEAEPDDERGRERVAK